MPPKKPERVVLHEQHLARRIRDERAAHDWTLDRLAEKMTAAGCPVDRSAIYRIESGDPPRRITIDEAVTFAAVFGRSLSEMLLPPGVSKSREASRLFKRYAQMRERVSALHGELRALEDALLAIAEDGFEQEVLEAMRGVDPRSVVHPSEDLATWRLTREFEAGNLNDLLDNEGPLADELRRRLAPEEE